MQGEISFFLHTGSRVVMCALVEVLRRLKMQPESKWGAVWGCMDWGSACACAASWGFQLNRKMLSLWSVLIPYPVRIRSEGSVWGCMKDNGQEPGARMMSPFNVCNNQHNWSVILSQPVKSFPLPRIHKLTALNFIMSEKHEARLFFLSSFYSLINMSKWGKCASYVGRTVYKYSCNNCWLIGSFLHCCPFYKYPRVGRSRF